MLTVFRRATKSVVGVIIIGVIGLMIVIGFALGDIQSLGAGGAGLSSSTLAEAGSEEITDRDISDAMQRRLAQVREQNPEATYATIAGDFDAILQSLIDERALEAFAKRHGFVLSKRLIDAEIARLPGVRGLDGQVTQQSYEAFLAQQRMTDAELRRLISGMLLQRLLVTPAASNARVPVGVATPYASMLLEERQGQLAVLPLEAFASGLNPSDAEVRQYYLANRNRYMVSEQRVLKIARIGPEQVNVQATPQEIEAYYRSRQDLYGAKDIRDIKQAVVPDQRAAAAIAQRARQGQSFAEAAKPAGLSAGDVSLGPQTRAEFTDIAGEKVAAAAFSAKAGTVVGPIKSDLGWHVVKIESAQTQQGKSLAQARDEIAAQILSEKRKSALADIVDKVQDAVDAGANFDEAARTANLTVTTTPEITASGTDRSNASYSFPSDLAPALRSGFELAPTDEPVVEQIDEENFALVAPARVIPAAPAPLESIREQVRKDWIGKQAADRALAAARQIAARATGDTSLADAVKAANVSLPPVQPMRARRIQLTQMGSDVPPPLRALFSTAEGKAQVGAVPQRGYFVVKVNEIVPGNALGQPSLISQVQGEFQDPVAQEYAQQFIAAVREDVNVRRNESAIGAAKKRITSGE